MSSISIKINITFILLLTVWVFDVVSNNGRAVSRREQVTRLKIFIIFTQVSVKIFTVNVYSKSTIFWNRNHSIFRSQNFRPNSKPLTLTNRPRPFHLTPYHFYSCCGNVKRIYNFLQISSK